MNSGPVFAVHFFDRFIYAAFKRNAVRHLASDQSARGIC
jgi:hypothetical protein